MRCGELLCVDGHGVAGILGGVQGRRLLDECSNGVLGVGLVGGGKGPFCVDVAESALRGGKAAQGHLISKLEVSSAELSRFYLPFYAGFALNPSGGIFFG